MSETVLFKANFGASMNVDPGREELFKNLDMVFSRDIGR